MDPKSIIAECLTRPENQLCADCQKNSPNWASANLGVFLCIDCSGIHRSLGTHISYVRSCTLDTWTTEQAHKMAAIGNQKSNEFFEAGLPPDFQRPDTSNRYLMTQFIRDKYVMRKWVTGNDNPQERFTPTPPQPVPQRQTPAARPAKAPSMTRTRSEIVSLSKGTTQPENSDEEVDIFGDPVQQHQRRSQPPPSSQSQVSTSDRKPGTRIPARLMKKMQDKKMPASRRSEPNLRRLSEDDPFA